MRNRPILTRVLFALVLTGVAKAQTGSGSMIVTADATGSITLTFRTDAGGLAVTGSDSRTASLPFSGVKMFGDSVPTKATKTLTGVAPFTLSTPFDVRADLTNSFSAAYTLSAMLAAADGANRWLIGATGISAARTASVPDTSGAYAKAIPYTVHLAGPDVFELHRLHRVRQLILVGSTQGA